MQAITEGYGLIEGPIWVAGKGVLFSDVQFGGVFCLDENNNVEQLFEHRKGIGGMAEHAQGGVVVSGRNISFKSYLGGPTVILLDREEQAGLMGFNDIVADPQGRVYAGGLSGNPLANDGTAPAAENLYLIDVDGTARVVARDIRLTNGLGFSPDGKTLYHSDTLRRSVFSYAVSSDGSLGPKEVFASTERGLPDGLKVSEDGAVWVALADGGSGVAVYNADSSLREYIDIPHPMCTSLCFGGDDLKDLYIVSGSDGLPGDKAGGIFKIRTDVPGLPLAVAKIRLA
ncbi:MAG: D-xylonolactonase [Candidatus Azotimanducaceae bacterium]|jgi:D-xylonolactonase